MTNLEKKLYDHFELIIEELGYELVDVSYRKEGKQWYLRFYIDRPGGIRINDCQWVTQHINPILDKMDPIGHQYFLEVSSAGLTRPLRREKDFARFYGQKVRVRLQTAFEGKKFFCGILLDNTPEFLKLAIGGKTIEIPKSIIVKVNLEPDFG